MRQTFAMAVHEHVSGDDDERTDSVGVADSVDSLFNNTGARAADALIDVAPGPVQPASRLFAEERRQHGPSADSRQVGSEGRGARRQRPHSARHVRGRRGSARRVGEGWPGASFVAAVVDGRLSRRGAVAVAVGVVGLTMLTVTLFAGGGGGGGAEPTAAAGSAQKSAAVAVPDVRSEAQRERASSERASKVSRVRESALERRAVARRRAAEREAVRLARLRATVRRRVARRAAARRRRAVVTRARSSVRAVPVRPAAVTPRAPLSAAAAPASCDEFPPC